MNKIQWSGLVLNACEVLYPINDTLCNGNDLWTAKCYCGKLFNVRPSDLKSTRVSSCGCLNKFRIGPTKNWYEFTSKSGCKILSPVIETKILGSDLWNVQCYCGKFFQSKPYYIKSNHTKSCGCLHKEVMSTVNIHNKKYNYYGYINEETNVKLLNPVDSEKDKGCDEWIALCPRHNPPIEFIAAAYDVVSGKIKSCKCLGNENRVKYIKEFNETRRKENNLEPTEYLMQKTELIRQMIFYPIKNFILKLDNNKCVRCGSTKHLVVHHIYSFLSIDLNNEFDLRKMFDINNVITLCDDDENNDCHYVAHNRNWYDLDVIVQKELLSLTSKRIISNELLDEYANIVNSKIEPSLINYLNNTKVTSGK